MASHGVDLLDGYRAVRRTTEELARPLGAEDCGVQSMPDASPTKWHLAHTSWFFETFVLVGMPGYRVFHPAFRTLFNSYYNGVGDRHARPARGLLSRPTLDEVRAYRRHVDDAMTRVLDDEGQRARAAGIVEIGVAAPADGAGARFTFDNESPRHAVLLQPHALASRLVTSGEYLGFMADGGYRRPELWLSDGWDAVQAGPIPSAT